jgi:hypothetical protein
MTLYSSIFEELTFARLIANYADALGASQSPRGERIISNHLGVVLADAILQAGVSYRTVVRSRVDRIRVLFPEAATLPGLMQVLEKHGAEEFLLWNHHIKRDRFILLTHFLYQQRVSNTADLHSWLPRAEARDSLLKLHGIGPKTYDYLCCLVGIDCIAVDRHVRTFASEAGVAVSDYDRLKTIVSNAADLLGIGRRDFDAWIWQTISSRNTGAQASLF